MPYFDYFVPWERKVRDIGGIASHQVPVEYSEHALVSNYQQIILLSLQLQNNWFKPNSDIVVGL